MREAESAEGREAFEFVRQTWPAHPGQLAPLREQVRSWLAPLSLTEDAEDDVVLAVSEAASNSVEHAYRPSTADDSVELTFWTEPPSFCVEISDHGLWWFRRMNPRDGAAGSR